MSTPPPTPPPDLTQTARSATRADLAAGSAGYPHFLQQLAHYISPAEALQTQTRFHAARKILLHLAAAFLIAYFLLNQFLGPLGLRPAAYANDALRAALLVASVTLITRFRLAVAAQILLPLAALTFLPMPIAQEKHWRTAPALFAAILFALFAAGWCLDAAASHNRPLNRWLPRLGLLAFALLNLAGYLWITEAPPPPFFSLAATFLALILLAKPPLQNPSDVEFLYAAAWKRWRFFLSGRTLAIILGLVPFLLFANLLDYHEQLERALHPGTAPEILRIPHEFNEWKAYFWRQEGRFLTTADFEPFPKDAPLLRAFYLLSPTIPTSPESLPPKCRSEPPVIFPKNFDFARAHADLLALNRQSLTRQQFLEKLQPFELLRITSECRLLQRTTDAFTDDYLILEFHQQSPTSGTCFAEDTRMVLRDPPELERLVQRYKISRWIFFLFGILGFIFLWRRGGDSSIARWVGIYLVGASLVPVLTASEDILPHLTHWLWQQSVLQHWNSLAATAQPLFNLLYVAAAAAALLWLAQLSFAACWTHFCWPTQIRPQWHPILRQLVIAGKLAATLLLTLCILGFAAIPLLVLKPKNPELTHFVTFLLAQTVIFIAVGILLRRFTRKHSEVPALGPWPIIAFVALNLSIICYAPILMFYTDDEAPQIFNYLGAAFGILFFLILAALILKRDFLRTRAIPGFTTLLLLIVLPLIIHFAEDSLPRFLAAGPFFREAGAELVSLMLVILLFPILHHHLHELLLNLSLPMLRKIEHSVEHALEAIVDAPDDAARNATISRLFHDLHVPQYLFLSRRPKHLYTADIIQLPNPAPQNLELSEPLAKFLGKRKHFVDLQAIAYEWPFFFHQFELQRIAQSTRCRYLLPVSIGDSLRALLLIPDGAGPDTIANPAVSPNITNLSIAATLTRPPH